MLKINYNFHTYTPYSMMPVYYFEDYEMNYIILDLETTGLHPEKGDVIIDVAAVKCTKDGIIERFQSYVNPEGKEVSDFIYKLTHTSPELLMNAPLATDVIVRLEAFLGDDYVMVGHNIAFDANVLSYYGVSIRDSQLLDTNDFATLYVEHAPSHSLEVLSAYLNFTHEGKHTAMGDVMACYHLLGYMSQQDKDRPHIREAGMTVEKVLPDWGGNAFWHVPEGMFTEKYQGPASEIVEEVELAIQEDSESYTISSALKEEAYALSLLGQSASSSVLVIPKQKITMFERFLATKEGESDYYYLPYLTSRLSINKIRQVTLRNEYLIHEAMLLLRCHILLHDHGTKVTIPKYPLSFTHRERALLGQIECGTLEEHGVIEGKVVTTYGTYFHQGLKSYLGDHKTMLYGADSREIHAIKEGTTIIYESFIQRLLGTIEANFEKSASEALMDIESLRRLLFYFFQNLVKLSTSANNAYVSYEDMVMLIEPISNSIPKAVDLLEHHIASHDLILRSGYAFRTLKDLLLRIVDPLCAASMYAYIYNNEAKVCIEPNSMEQSVNAMESMSKVDSMFLLDKAVSNSTQLGTMSSVTHSVIFDDKPLRSTTSFVEFLLSQKKTVVVTNKGSDRDQWFHELYDNHNSDDFRVLSYGQSGGGGKVEYMFEQAESGVLFLKADDFLNLRNPTNASTLCIASLPFSVMTERYFMEKYGRSSFIELALPVLEHTLLDCIYKMQRIGAKECTMYLLDDRLWTKRYCEEIRQRIQKRFDVK